MVDDVRADILRAMQQTAPGYVSPADVAAGAKPVIPQAGGDISTEKSIGVEMDGKHYVIPTIIGGVSYTPDAAIEAFRSGKNPHLGVFDSEQEATAFAEQRSRDLDAAFGGGGVLRKGPSAPAAGGLLDGYGKAPAAPYGRVPGNYERAR